MPAPAPSRRERALFDQAFALAEPAERTAFLDRVCAGDPALRTRLDALLAAAAPSEAFFARLSPTVASLGSCAGTGSGPAADCITQIGRYRLLERIGEGGHGIVYRAEQHEPVRRQVALKIIRPGMDTEAVIARFEAERQALALMEHPYIARVLDAGATASGRPFFVMEWVQGERITAYCDRHRLPLERRIELLAQVCQAVQHAHQKGVIHRDLKPSNLLVVDIDGQPAPKVIDFGIAKAAGAGPRLSGRTLHTTELGAFIGTPAYMSPEHADEMSAGVDTRGDVFSLGVVLCELIAGSPPFPAPDWARLPPDEIRRFVRAREPRRPSAVFVELAPATAAETAALRGLAPARLAEALRGDLDWIALKALAPDRERRYESVAAFAADLRAHLGHAVVSARPPSRVYQVRRFVRRHRGPVLATSLVLASVLGGLVATTRLYLREQHALRAQLEFSRQAEEARANEALLRRRAEAGERVARAAVQISYKQPEEADALVAGLDLSLVQPSLESSLVFRTLAFWHAQADHWPEAARFYAALAESITSIDPSDTQGVSNQLMPAATTILRAGDREGYDRFRAVLLRRFGATEQVVVAEQVLKCTLLAPADAESLRRLEPLYAQVREAVIGPDADRDAYMKAWRAFALALMDYRRGRPADTLSWADICLASPNKNEARSASAHLLRALALRALGRAPEGADALREAEQLIERHRASTPAERTQQGGFWFDWVNVELLRVEFAGGPKA